MYSTKRKNGGIRLGRWKSVIDVTRINNTRFVLIQTVEETPDTVITLTTGAKYVVKESCEEIKKKVLEYKRSIISVLNENM